MSTTTSVDLYEEATRRRKRTKVAGKRQVTVAQPRTADDISNILNNPQDYPSPVRPLGSGSCVTRCATTATGTLIDMSLCDRVLGMTEDTVTVQAGIRLRDLAEYLAEDGKELICGSVDANRTVGGAISSGTLGGCVPGEASQIASTVSHITLINGLGKRVEVTAKLPDLLVLTRMSYGLLGVVYAAKLRIRPIQSYAVRSSKFDFDEFAKVIPTLMKVQGQVRASLMPFRNRVYVELRYPDVTGKASADLPWKLRDWAANTALPSVARSVSKAMPIKSLRDPLIDGFTEATHVLFGATLASSGSNSVEQTGRFKMLKAEPASERCVWYFPVEQMPALLAAYRKFCAGHYRQYKFRCDLPAELWRVDHDQHALLSPSFNGSVFAFNLRTASNDGWDDYLLEFAEFAAHFRGVPSFNQTRGFKPGYANRAYGERLARFKDIRQRLDPKDRLLNQFFAEHLR